MTRALRLAPTLVAVALTLSACGDDVPTTCFDDTNCPLGSRCQTGVCVPGGGGADAGDAGDGGGQPDGGVDAADVTSDADAPTCEPSCESLRREACVDGACGDCLEGFTPASGAATAACCGPGEVPTSDGLGCEVPPECVGVICENGGVCAVVAGLGICDCPAGTEGDRCEVACASEPLVPSECLIGVDDIDQDCLGWFTDEGVGWSGGSCGVDDICRPTDDCESDECVSLPIVLVFDEGVAINRIDWRADWWAKRPDRVTLRTVDNPEAPVPEWPVAAEFAGRPEPWQCVTGEACSEEVPDECCPDGRDAPQRIEDGALISKWDIARFDAVPGQGFAYFIESTHDPRNLIFQDMRAFGSTCLGGLACDPATENCGEACGPGETWDGSTCADIDGCAGDPCFDGVTCTDVPAPGTGFECGPCPDGTEGDGVTCTPTDCTPECPEWQQCVAGSCQARPCSSGCNGGTCFEGTCAESGVCEDLCAARYGSGRTWQCDGGGYCAIRDCSRGTDCGGGIDCVSDPDNNSRGPGGVGVFDQTCEPGGASPCGGTCDGLCSASSGRCSG